jgi:hypothetical protein
MGSTSSCDFPGFEHLYSLQDPGKVRYFRADFELDLSIDAGLLLRGSKVVDGPLKCSWVQGGRMSDVIWTTHNAVVLFSGRLLAALQTQGVTGWTPYNIELLDRQGRLVPDYRGFAVVGRCGRTEESRGRLVQTDRPGAWRTVLQGLYFDETEWDGSDVFVPPDANYIFITEPVKQVFEALNVKNVAITRLTEKQIPEAVIRPFPDDVLH